MLPLEKIFNPIPRWNEIITLEWTRSLDYKFITLQYSHFGLNCSNNYVLFYLIPVSKNGLEL